MANWQAGYSDIFPREAGNLDFISSVLIVLKKHCVCQEEVPCWPQLTVIILWPLFLVVTFISKYFALCGLGRMYHGMYQKVSMLGKTRLTPPEISFPEVGARGLSSSSESPLVWPDVVSERETVNPSG